MSYILCIAEKPSVAKDIARVIGATEKKKGFYEGNGYKVTWALGHLVGLAEPEIYGFMSLTEIWDKKNPQNKEKALIELPLIPDSFKLIVLENTKDQFNVVKNLMNDKDCLSLIDCGDCGAEGHILQWFIRVKAGCTKPVKRFMATSMTDEAINQAMNNLQDINKYLPIIKGEYCKKKADWIIGMSMSRAASITYNARIDVGRVQSPTLYFIVKRFLDINNFKSIDYFTIKANLKNDLSVFWKKDFFNYFLPEKKDSDNRLLDKGSAEKAVKDIVRSGKGLITLLETTNKYTDRPQLYDITELERDGNRRYGYTAEQVLTAAQKLYETYKITTYPRTDSRYITHDLVPYMDLRVQDISSISKYHDISKSVLDTGLNIDKRIMDDTKVTDHHAIIVTDKIKGFNISQLSQLENDVLDLIITRMLVSFSGKYIYKETVVNVTFENGMVFNACGKIPIYLGWKSVYHKLSESMQSEDECEEQQLFPELTLGQSIDVASVILEEKKTAPPKLHTEATLLTSMENAGRSISGGEILKGKGIGTQATRAHIIKQLIDKGYVTNHKVGKTNYLVPTKQGLSVIKVIPSDLYSPKLTADWEQQIAEIVSGKKTDIEFMVNFRDFIVKKVEEIKGRDIKDVDFRIENQIMGKCPWCGKPVYNGKFKDKEGKKVENVYCSNGDCKFSLRKDNIIFVSRTGKYLNDSHIKKLLVDNFIEVNCVSKNKVKYKGSFHIDKNDNGYAELYFKISSKRNKKDPK